MFNSYTFNQTRFNSVGTTAWQKVLNESMSLADSLLRGPNKLFSEVLNLTESFIRGAGKAISDNLNISDTLIKVGVFIRTLAETLNIGDAIKRTTGKILSDALNIAEVIKKGAGRIFSDVLFFSDSIKRTTDKILSEQLNIADTLSKISVFIRTLTTEILSIAEGLIKNPRKVLSGTLTTTDSIDLVAVPSIVILIFHNKVQSSIVPSTPAINLMGLLISKAV